MRAETTLTAIHAARSVQSLPDGSPIPNGLAHALLVLATYYPNIWPSQARLAADMSVSRANVNKRLRALEDAGLIHRLYRGRNRSTLYRLDLKAIRRCIGSDTEAVSVPIQEYQTSNDTDTEGVEWDFSDDRCQGT